MVISGVRGTRRLHRVDADNWLGGELTRYIDTLEYVVGDEADNQDAEITWNYGQK